MHGCFWPRLCKNVEELSDWRFYALRRHLNFGSMSLMQPRRTDKEPRSGSHCCNQHIVSQYLHHAFQIVGKHMQSHFRTHPIQSLGQEMRTAHP